MGCRVNSGTVTVVDTWNPSPQRTANVLDATQNGLCVQSTSFTNSRITCRCVVPLINIYMCLYLTLLSTGSVGLLPLLMLVKIITWTIHSIFCLEDVQQV